MYKLLKMKLGQQNNCPFPHVHKDGHTYYETNASSGLSETGQFNCFVCGRKFSDEIWFTSTYLNVSYKEAKEWIQMLKNSRLFIPNMTKWKIHQERLKEALKDEENKHYIYLKNLGLLDIVEDARLGIYMDHITFPYVYKGLILNLTQFCPGETPKYRNTSGALAGIVGTTKRFKPSEKYIIIAAGEKDMLELNAHGFNAVTLLGGEKVKPKFYKKLFKDKEVYIAYDNDEKGIEGALELAKWLYRYTTKIKVLNVGDVYNELEGDLTAVAKENKEDVTDFFVKYEKTDLDFVNIMDNANWFQPPAKEDSTLIELVGKVNETIKTLTERILKDNNIVIQNNKKREEKKNE